MNYETFTNTNSLTLPSSVQWDIWVAGHRGDFDDGGASVREPRHPNPPSPLAGAVAIERGY